MAGQRKNEPAVSRERRNEPAVSGQRTPQDAQRSGQPRPVWLTSTLTLASANQPLLWRAVPCAPIRGTGHVLPSANQPYRACVPLRPVLNPYEPGTCQSLLKWKPSNMNSIDFRIKTVSPALTTHPGPSPSPHPNPHLKPNPNTTLTPTSTLTLTPTLTPTPTLGLAL